MKNFILNKILLTIFNSRRETGFTLVELLVAVIMAGIVVAGASTGLTYMLQANAESESETLRRIEINRAMDFIAEEMRMSSSVSLDPSTDAPGASAIASSTASSSDTVLVLTIPNVVDPVIYRIATPNTSTVWQGPKAIYRWGPNLNADGTYSDPSNSGSWSNRLLVDLVEDSGTTVSCESGFTKVPSSSTPPGFYACIEDDSDPATPSRTATLYLKGKIIGAYDNVLDPYEASTKVFARSN